MNNNLYIMWGKKNEIGIPIIDEQHRGVISAINSLYYSIQTGDGDKMIEPTIITLQQYVKVHFKIEEELIKKAKYPYLDEHLSLHEIFVDRIRKLSIVSSKKKDSDMVLKFLKEWWLNHISQEDSKYAPFVKNFLGANQK